ncbi:alpha/beta hydrolase [Corynebacterium sp. ES2794-CONJ1]|uniref:alpha/beta fold hydrolase n=1 Tax=unclassified Corynebacterium TaxID=2624378 RepID=UPI002167663B|nr:MULTISPECIES: alpha/beta hydrolase [unclassified Corynebacterium]MCS4490605.1 alpha/beta hydrolase [Corynebacterium sp. ES2775-CONJ]MCU9519819.1 alpha/beta hydrolase [Corynebacterium sp. ES2794-CONJ1]
MLLSQLKKRYQRWRIAQNTREQEYRPPQFSTGFNADGVRYYCEGEPSNDAPVTVVFVHGYTLTATSWHLQIASLAHQVSCVAMDLRGHGKSEVIPVSECSIDGAADDVMLVIDDAEITGPIILVGHSMGGMVILNLLRRYPQLRSRCAGIALISTSARPFAHSGLSQVLQLPIVDDIRSIARAAAEETDYVREVLQTTLVPLLSNLAIVTRSTEETRKHHIKMIDGTPIETLVGFLDDLETHDESEALKYIRDIPTRIMVGDKDDFTPESQSSFMLSQLTKGRLVVVPDVGHMLPMENPGIVNAEIADLIAQVIEDNHHSRNR